MVGAGGGEGEGHGSGAVSAFSYCYQRDANKRVLDFFPIRLFWEKYTHKTGRVAGRQAARQDGRQFSGMCRDKQEKRVEEKHGKPGEKCRAGFRSKDARRRRGEEKRKHEGEEGSYQVRK